MSGPTESERLYVVETKLDTVLAAVSSTNAKLDGLSESIINRATKAELAEAILERDLAMETLKTTLQGQIKEIQKKHQLTVWLTALMSAGASLALTLLIQNAMK